MSKDIQRAVKILKQGGVVVYPTDTAYGFAADATSEKAVKRLYKLKGRNFKQPTHVIFPDVRWLKKIVELNKPALKLMNSFLPGPLTIILPIKIRGKSWNKLSAGSGTMGVRFPNNQTAQVLVEAFGKPITTTSANLSGEPTGYSVNQIKKQFAASAHKPDFYLDAGRLAKIKPSTMVSVLNNSVTILREGPISEKQIKLVLKK